MYTTWYTLGIHHPVYTLRYKTGMRRREPSILPVYEVYEARRALYSPCLREIMRRREPSILPVLGQL